jgi:hypothetical protein
MEQKNIALELLVRSGNPEGVEQIAKTQKLKEELKTEKIAEAGIYAAIKLMREEAEGGIDSERICPYLNQKRFTNYFSAVNNTEVLEKIVDVLKAGTHAMMEAYAKITAIDLLGIDSLAGAIRRNIDAPHMKKKVTELVKGGYALVFCPHDIDAEMVDHYFPVIDKWRDFIEPQKVAAQAIMRFAEGCENLSEGDSQKEFVYTALDKLVELTDRETVSRLMHEHFGEREDYQIFIDDGKIDAYKPKPLTKRLKGADTKVVSAIKKYENEIFPSNSVVTHLAKTIGDSEREYVAQRMGQWFREGRIKHLIGVAAFEEGRLYDHDIARRVIGNVIAKFSQQGNFKRLGKVLDLPQHLIDETNPAISEVVQAYRISQQKETKEKQE